MLDQEKALRDPVDIVIRSIMHGVRDSLKNSMHPIEPHKHSLFEENELQSIIKLRKEIDALRIPRIS